MNESEYIRHRVQCESALVAIAFYNPIEAIDRVASVVTPSDFADRELGRVYEILSDLRSAGVRIELEAVAAEMRKRGLIESIGAHSLRKIVDSKVAVGNAEYYAAEVARLADNRRVIAAARRVLATEHDINADPHETISRFESDSQLTRLTDESSTFSQAIRRMADEHYATQQQDSRPITKTGIGSIDEATSGMHKQQLWLLGARSGTGKTAMALTIASNVAQSGGSVVYFSLEMSRSELAERVCSDQLSIKFSRFSHQTLERHHFDRLNEAVENYADWPFVILDRPSQSVREMAAKAKIYNPGKQLDLIIVDTLQRVNPHNRRQDRRLQLQEICVGLSDLAKTMNCTVLVCSQLNANAIGREPTLADLSEGKQIIEPVDTCMLLHRPDPNEEEMLVKLEKVRRGGPQSFWIRFDGSYQRFSETPKSQEWTG